MRRLMVLAAGLMLNGCVAQLAADVITAPIKVASKTVDVLTTSQAEADRNRGRDIRKQEERAAKDQKKAEKEAKRRARDDGN
jgi:uncharacterized lipoprotein YajG